MSVQTREVTKTVTTQVLACDGCGTDGPEVAHGVPLTQTASDWIYIRLDNEAYRMGEFEALTLCSWRCVANYADDKQSAAVAEPVGAA